MIRPKSKETVREEARAWVRRLNDVHSAADREEFQRWLGEDAANQSVYDQVLASYHASGVLRASEIGRRRDLGSAFPKRTAGWGRAVATASVAGLLLVGVYQLTQGSGSLQPVAIASVMLASGEEPRNVELADGSRVSMAPASEVRVNLSRSERRLVLRKGRVRLSVARERRPFRIVAGDEVFEAGTGVFDASIVNGQGQVSATAASETGDVSLERDRTEPNSSNAAAVRQTIEFNAEPLGKAIERINQAGAGRRIELDPKLARLRVTGVFQRGDSETIARSIALAFGLEVISTHSGALLLTRDK